jgi:hypothetical protein
MKLHLPLTLCAASLLMPFALTAQTYGTSHPEDLNDNIVTTSPAPPQQHYVKPSAGIPLTADAAATDATPQLATRQPAADNSVNAQSTFTVTDDPNSGVVIDVPTGPNDLPIGTRLTAQMQTEVSTKVTPAGTPFTAALIADVMQQGRVLLPAGSTVHGRITQIHGGRRIGGASAIRLQPDTISLPDGTTYRLDAEVSDLDHYQDSHVNREGAIVSNSHGKTAAIVLSATTGTAVVAGAMLGGGVGAVVGLGIGAGAGVVWWLKQDHQQTLPQGTEIVFSLNGPLHVSPVAH